MWVLVDIFLPWFALAQARRRIEALRDEKQVLIVENCTLANSLSFARAQIAKFDGDGDGKIGGSLRRVKA
jgi:hypothetical protein